MTAAVLALQLIAAAPVSAAAVSYVTVPATVIRTSVYGLDDESRPVRARAELATDGTRVIVRASCHRCIVIFERQEGGYIVDGPFWWPLDDAERVLDGRWRRTVAVTAPESARDLGSLAWVSAAPELTGDWPRCFAVNPRMFSCWGVTIGEAGVVVGQAMNRVWWATLSDGYPQGLKASQWGRLIRVDGMSGDDSRLSIRFAHPLAQSAQRPRGLRLATARTAAQSVVIASGVAWLWGDDLPADAWAEVRTSREGPVYIDLAEIAGGSPTLLMVTRLRETRLFDGRVTTGRDQPAPAALVSVFRLIDPPASGVSPTEKPPRRVLVAETTTDASGRFRIDGAGESIYELVAWHSTLGRASVVFREIPDELTVHLQSPGTVRGRVVSGGKPLAGVEVRSLPAPEAYRDAEDLIDLKGGDARTRADGRFELMVASSGGGELRAGGGPFPVKRIPLPRSPAPLLDLGDIELGAGIEFTLVLDRDTPCDIRATGPIGESGLQIVMGSRIGPGLFRLVLPESGIWAFGVACGRQGHELNPATLRITPAHVGTEVRFALR